MYSNLCESANKLSKRLNADWENQRGNDALLSMILQIGLAHHVGKAIMVMSFASSRALSRAGEANGP